MSTSITSILAENKIDRTSSEDKSRNDLDGESSTAASAETIAKNSHKELEQNVSSIDIQPGTTPKNADVESGLGNQHDTGSQLSVNKSTINKSKKSIPWDRYAVRTAAIIGAIVLWHLCSTFAFNFIISFENIPKPTVVGSHFITLLGTEEFYTHILVSLKRILIGFLLASLLGVAAGVLMGRSKIICDILMPYIEILRPIPAVAWIPLAILMLPTEESSIIYITFLGAFFPIVLNTVHGVEQTEETLVRAAKSLGASNFAILWHVILPGALPSIMAGLAIGMGVSWFSLLAGEIISGQYGIGYFTWNSYTLVEYPNIIIGMLVIGGLGTLSTWLVKQASKPALRWQEQQQ
jgi:NitT/TauT family transport system permease protein